MSQSLAQKLAELARDERAEILARYPESVVGGLRYTWEFFARPEQIAPPGAWRTWLILAGRGWGKSRVGAEWSRGFGDPKSPPTRGALVARTAADGRDVMVEGQSGVLACSPPDNRPLYEPSKRRLTWPNGTMATVYSADEPDLLRGPQHHWAWADELAAWNRPAAWDMLRMGLRLGDDPRCVVTTTPRPLRMIRELAKESLTAVTRGSTHDNRANLPSAFLDEIIRKYEGTTLGRQELYAELLDEAPGALWKRAQIEAMRVEKAPELKRIVVAVDPAATSGDSANDTGIVVAGKGTDGHGYVLADLTCHKTPAGWARDAINAYHDYRADRLVAEVNHGGEMITQTLHSIDPSVPVKTVTASRGKAIRAEPISALYEQGRMHHVGGSFAALEDQMANWTPDSGDSPDRIDALVWAMTELMMGVQVVVI